MYTEVTFISSLDYSCLLNEFSDIITTQVLPVGKPHAEATTEQKYEHGDRDG